MATRPATDVLLNAAQTAIDVTPVQVPGHVFLHKSMPLQAMYKRA